MLRYGGHYPATFCTPIKSGIFSLRPKLHAWGG